jgi:hypothetical protein
LYIRLYLKINFYYYSSIKSQASQMVPPLLVCNYFSMRVTFLVAYYNRKTYEFGKLRDRAEGDGIFYV